MKSCKSSYNEYVKCMKKHNLSHHENKFKRYLYCGRNYANFFKCINSITTSQKIDGSKCPKLKK